jgi:hypothetical protein
MKALCCFETSETTHPTTGCLIPEDLNPQYIKIYPMGFGQVFEKSGRRQRDILRVSLFYWGEWGVGRIFTAGCAKSNLPRKG